MDLNLLRDYFSVKRMEKMIPLGHITGFEVAIGVREDIWNKLQSILSDTEGLRIAIRRDLSDEYPCSPGSYFGQDVVVIVKPGHYRNNKDVIEKLKTVFNQ